MRFIKVFLGLVFLVFMALLPLRASQFLGKRLANAWYKSKTSRSYRVSKANIDCCLPDLGDSEREALLKESLQHTGMSYAEMGMSWLWPATKTLKKVISVEGEQVLEDAVAARKGVLIIAPHIGNWEVLNLYASNKHAITVLYKPPKLKFFDWLINKMRKRLGGDMAPANAAGVRKLLKKLRKNGVVAILPDQEPAEGSGVFSHFFGRQTYTMTLLSQLAAKTQCAVIAGVAIRLPNGEGYRIKFSKVDGEINSSDQQQSVEALNHAIEVIVKENPAQYQWEYKRFKKLAPSQTQLY